jgi:hypothetical protein
VTRRVSLPGVDELFRSSRTPPPGPDDDAKSASRQVDKDAEVQADPIPKLQVVTASTAMGAAARPELTEPTATPGPPEPSPGPTPAPVAGEDTKRPRHEEKVTFYCTGSDLTRIERARLTLRADYRLASDRGRIVRAALAEILDDFEQHGADSALVRRLRTRAADDK